VAYILADSQPKVMLCDPSFAPIISDAMRHLSSSGQRLDNLRAIVFVTCEDGKAQCDVEEILAAAAAAVGPASAAQISVHDSEEAARYTHRPSLLPRCAQR
jgi:ribosomal protein L12E/L44/L45/RPP1/RPP2